MTHIDIERLRTDLATLDVRADEEWYAYIHKGGYDLCVQSARRQPTHPNAATDAIIGRFACGEYAIKALPVVAQAMNALPHLLDRIALLEEAVREADGALDANDRLLKSVLAAIDTGRSEPLFIVRDQLRNYFEDKAKALSTEGSRERG